MADPYADIASPAADPYATIAKPVAGRPAAPPKRNYATGVMNSIGSGVPFLQDVAAVVQSNIDRPGAALRNLVGAGSVQDHQAVEDRRKYLRDQARSETHSFMNTNPWSAMLGNTAGIAASMFLPGPKGAGVAIQPVNAATKVGKVAQVAANVGRSAVAGGTAGAVYGLGGDGETAGDRLNQASTGALIGAATGGLTGAFGGRATKVKSKGPSLADLVAEKDAAYKAVDDMGVTYSPEAMKGLVTGLSDEAKAASLSASRHPKAASMLDDIQAMNGQSPTLTQVDQLRQVVRRDVANSKDDAEAFFGKKMIKGIDEFLNAAGPGQVLAGDAERGADAINTARQLNTRVSKIEAVQDAVEHAKNIAGPSGSGGNINNATRAGMRGVLEHTGNLTADEEAALKQIVRGTPGQNALRLAGKLSPTGNGLNLALHTGAAVATHGVSTAASAGGAVAKIAADRMTQQRVQALIDLMAKGGKTAEMAQTSLATMAAKDPAVADLVSRIPRFVGAGSAIAAQ